MKIALISHLYPTKLFPYQGKFIQDQLALFEQHDTIDIDLLVPTPYSLPFTERWEKNSSDILYSSTKKPRIKYLSFPNRRFPKLVSHSLSSKLLNTLEKEKYDLVHVHWLYPDGFAIPELKRMGYKTILTIHGSDWYKAIKNKKLEPHIRKALNSVDKVLYSGPDLKKDIESAFPYLASKSEVIYNMVDESKYAPLNQEDKKRTKKKLGWDSNKIHALTVANLRHEKGIDLLIGAIEKEKKLKNVQFHLVGGTEKTQFSKKIVRSLNKLSNLTLHKPVPPNKLVEYYQSSDFYILPSRNEGFGLALVEASFVGLPFIATKTGIAPLLEELGFGITLPIDNFSKAFSKKLEKSIEFKRPKNPGSILSKNFGQEKFKQHLLKIYLSVYND